MSEETTVTETTESQETKETQETEKTSESKESKEESKETKEKAPKKSFADYLKDEKEPKSTEKTKEPDEESEKKEGDKAKGKPAKVPANERIQGLIKEREERDGRISELEEADKASKAQIVELEKGKETPKAVNVKKDEAVDYKELKEELEDMSWTDKQIGVYIKNLKNQEKLTAEIEELKADKIEREEKEDKKSQKAFQDENADNYKKTAKKYPDLFDKPDEESGYPQMKKEFDKEALRISDKFNIPYDEVDGEVVNYNPLLTTEEGLDMLFSFITRKDRATKEAKKELEAKVKLKTKVVETPESRTVTKTTKRTFGDYLQAEKDARQ